LAIAMIATIVGSGSLVRPKPAAAATQDVLDIVAGLNSFADYSKALSSDGTLGKGLALVG